MSNESPTSSGGGQAGPPLLSDFASDPDMLELVEMFVAEMPQRVAAIEKAVSDSDTESIASLAHQLKGAAGGYGFGCITDAAGIVEKDARDRKQLGELQGSIDELLSLCRRASCAAG